MDLTPFDALRGTQTFTSTIWSQERRLQSPDNTRRFQWLLGGYFEAREFKNTDDSVIFGNDALAVLGLPPSADVVDGEVDTTILAGFGQISYQLVEALTLTSGLRYESTDVTLQRLEHTFTTDGYPSLITLAAEGIEQNSDAVLPRVAIEYRFSPNAMVYGSIARGFKPAGMNSRAADATTLTFGAERSWIYEIGLKSSWFDNKLTVNLASKTMASYKFENYGIYSICQQYF